MSKQFEAAPATAAFEDKFTLLPLGDDLEARVGRIETILGRFLAAALDREETVTVFAGQYVHIPVPSVDSANHALDAYRAPEVVEQRKAYESALLESEIVE